jgi:hypothetical protein
MENFTETAVSTDYSKYQEYSCFGVLQNFGCCSCAFGDHPSSSAGDPHYCGHSNEAFRYYRFSFED